MVKLAFKIINGYGPYAYLQKSIKYPDGKVVSKHIKYLGSVANPKGNYNLAPGGTIKYRGEIINVPQLPKEQFDQLKPGPQKKYQDLSAGTPPKPAAVAPKPAAAPTPAGTGGTSTTQPLPGSPKVPGYLSKPLGTGGLTAAQWQITIGNIQANVAPKDQQAVIAGTLAAIQANSMKLFDLIKTREPLSTKAKLLTIAAFKTSEKKLNEPASLQKQQVPPAKLKKAPVAPKTPDTLEGGDDSQQSEMVKSVADKDTKLPKQSTPTDAVIDSQEKVFTKGKKDWNADLEFVSGKKGSNEGGLYKDKKLQTFHYVKWPGEERARMEVLAGMLYRHAGVPVPETRIGKVNNKTAVISDWIEGAKPMSIAELKKNKQVRQGFIADAWLANWDVVGLKADNIVKAPGGSAVRIDPGGTMFFRAQGAKKAFPHNDVAELETMRNPQTAKQAGQVFMDLTSKELKDSSAKVVKISDIQIDDAVDSAFPVTNPYNSLLKKTLKGRRNYLQTNVIKGKVASKKLPIAAVAKQSKIPKETVESLAVPIAKNSPGSYKTPFLEQVSSASGDLVPGKTAAERRSAAKKVSKLFGTWKGTTTNSDSNLLRWATSEAQGGKGSMTRNNMIKFWKFKEKSLSGKKPKNFSGGGNSYAVKNFQSDLDTRIENEGAVAVDGVKIHNRANIAVGNLRFHNTDKLGPGKTIKVYRSFKPDQVAFLGWKGAQLGDKLKVNNPDIFSYSFSTSTAKNFGGGHGGLTVSAEIPLRNVLVTDRVSNTVGSHTGEDEVLWIKRPATLEVIAAP